MSAAKPEKAQAPPLASQANNSGQVSHQQQQQPHQPHPHNYHQGQVVYQQPYNNHMQSYQQQGPPVWNQPPQSAVHYVHYGPQQGEPVNYQETGKVQGYNHYGTVHFTQPMDNGGMMMGDNSGGYGPQQYSQTWYPPGSQQQTTQFIPTYATTFNVANDPAYHPNHPMNRPNGGGRQDEYQSGNESTSANYMQFVPFVAPIVESQAHASASYTANWVSSTSSIPPEMKDKPEENCFHNDDGPRSSSQMNGENWTDREDHMSPSTTQQPFQLPQQSRPAPYVEKDKAASQSTTKTSKSAKGERSEEGRELTFDERLEKARMQKTRAENKGANGESSSNLAAQHGSNQAVSPSSGNTPRSYSQRKEYSGPPRSNGGGYQNNSSQNNMRGGNNQARGGGGNHNYNGNNNGGGAGEQYPRKQQQQQQQQYYQQQQHPNANQGRDRNNSKRVNDYSAYRYENNQNNSSYNQRNMQQNQVVPEFGRSPNYKGKNPRPYRGGYQGQGLQHQQPPPPPQQPNEGANRYQGAPQIMNPQVMSTMNAFQNTHIGNVPLGGHRAPLLPGPFGMTRPPQIQQDAKFHNTWLDAASCPMPLAAVMSMDTRFGGFAPSYRGRGRGGAGGFANRGGFRGTYGGPRYSGRPAAEPVMAEPRVVEQNNSTKPADETQPESQTEKVEAKEEPEVEKKTEQPSEAQPQPEVQPETPSEVKPTVTINIQPETPKHNASEDKKEDEKNRSDSKSASEKETTDES